VMRHGYKHGRNGNPWPYAAAGVAVIVGVIVWLAPNSTGSPSTALPPVSVSTPVIADAVPAAITKIIEQRCVMCHGAQMQMKNVRLDSVNNVQKNKAMIYQQVVVTQQMPMNNATGITPEERRMISDWLKP
jgi:uncharacterized membrane protein